MTPRIPSTRGALRRLPLTMTFAFALAQLAGCDGGGGTATAPPAAAQAPQLFGLAAISLDQDTTSAPQAFRIVDADTGVAQLELAVGTSDPSLLPLSGIAVRGDGADRTITFTPNPEATGTVSVTVTVRDPGGLAAASTIAVQVRPVLVSFKTLANDSFSMAEGGDLAKVSGVTLQADADDDPTAFDALLR